MIGEASITSPAPISTGKRPSWRQPAAAGAAGGGGSSSETNAPSSLASMAWTAAREWPRTSWRRAEPAQAVRLCTATEILTSWASSSAGVAWTRTSPVSGCRILTTRPAVAPAASRISSVSAPPANWKCSSWASVSSAARARPGRSTTRSTASSQLTYTWPSTSSFSTGAKAAPASPAISTARCCTWRHRTRTATKPVGPGWSRHSVPSHDRSEGSAALNACGLITPNCQRNWFLRADAR